MRSLPAGCSFTVLSFGSDFTFLEHNGSNVISYDQDSMNYAINQNRGFSDDHGGTNIASPLMIAKTLASKVDPVG